MKYESISFLVIIHLCDNGSLFSPKILPHGSDHPENASLQLSSIMMHIGKSPRPSKTSSSSSKTRFKLSKKRIAAVIVSILKTVARSGYPNQIARQHSPCMSKHCSHDYENLSVQFSRCHSIYLIDATVIKQCCALFSCMKGLCDQIQID